MAAPSPAGAAILLALLSLLSIAALLEAAAGVGPWGLGVPHAHHRQAASKSSAWRGDFGLGAKREPLQWCVCVLLMV